MHLYAKGVLAFCVQVPESARTVFETKALYDFNRANRTDLGYASLGSFGNEDLWLTAFYQEAEPLEPVEINIVAIGRERVRFWRKDIQKFLREQKIEPVGEIRFRILSDLDN